MPNGFEKASGARRHTASCSNVVAASDGGATGLQLADWLGTIRAAYSYTGGVESTSGAHAPFGEAYAYDAGNIGGFTGQGGDGWGEGGTGNGQYWFPERQYNSGQGRWLSPDPSGLAAVNPTSPQTWNRYTYVGNNPLSNVDPTGLQQCPNQQNPAICQGGYLINDPFFLNFLNDEFDNVTGWNGEDYIIGPPMASAGTHCFPYVQTNCGSYDPPANNDPQTGVPANPCASAGGAPNPSAYATAGTIANVSEFLSPGGLLVNAAFLFSFRSGGALDAQPLGGSRAYGNYVFGAYASAAGIPLSVALDGANGYASVKNAQYPGFTMDPNYPAIPQANVANIVNGYNAQQNGTLCHK